MSPFTTKSMLTIFLSVFGLLFIVAKASPFPAEPVKRFRTLSLESRAEPYFPEAPPSCPKCQADYGSIQNCAEAAPVLANFTMIIFNPSAFIDVIQCACTETFQAVFPQCVDCFQRTNQTDVLNTDDLPSVVSGMRQICALQSSLLGDVRSANGELSATETAAPAATSNAALGSDVLPSFWNMFPAVVVLTIVGFSSLAVL